jgi:magnesium transporter
MIQIWKREGGRITPTMEAGENCWIDARNVTKEELSLFESDYHILPDHLQDILDLDEQPRVEKEDDYTMLVVRLPVYDPRQEVAFFTVPVGIFLMADRIITICQADSDSLADLASNRVRNFDPRNRASFVLHLIGRGAMVYLRYLKEINRRTTAIERDLQRSVKNNELVQLLSLQKSLVFFTTSLRSNEIVIDKLKLARALRFREEESDLHEDVVTDNRQAIEMANIYSDILTGTMDAFASVISNNLNMVMKRLTIISIVLMIPTLVVSIFGMNVPLPLQNEPEALGIIIGVSAVLGGMSALLLRDRPNKRKPIRGTTQQAVTNPRNAGIQQEHPPINGPQSAGLPQAAPISAKAKQKRALMTTAKRPADDPASAQESSAKRTRKGVSAPRKTAIQGALMEK